MGPPLPAKPPPPFVPYNLLARAHAMLCASGFSERILRLVLHTNVGQPLSVPLFHLSCLFVYRAHVISPRQTFGGEGLERALGHSLHALVTHILKIFVVKTCNLHPGFQMIHIDSYRRHDFGVRHRECGVRHRECGRGSFLLAELRSNLLV